MLLLPSGRIRQVLGLHVLTAAPSRHRMTMTNDKLPRIVYAEPPAKRPRKVDAVRRYARLLQQQGTDEL